MKLHQLLKPDLIKLDLNSDDRTGIIGELVDLLAHAGYLKDAESVRRMVVNRESEVGTGIGYGVAIPHCDPGPFPQPMLAFGRLSNGIDFQAPDNKPVRLIFLLLTSDKTPALHVRLLARICRLLKSRELRQKLLEAPDSEAAAGAIAAQEADYPELTP